MKIMVYKILAKETGVGGY